MRSHWFPENVRRALTARARRSSITVLHWQQPPKPVGGKPATEYTSPQEQNGARVVRYGQYEPAMREEGVPAMPASWARATDAGATAHNASEHCCKGPCLLCRPHDQNGTQEASPSPNPNPYEAPQTPRRLHGENTCARLVTGTGKEEQASRKRWGHYRVVTWDWLKATRGEQEK